MCDLVSVRIPCRASPRTAARCLRFIRAMEAERSPAALMPEAGRYSDAQGNGRCLPGDSCPAPVLHRLIENSVSENMSVRQLPWPGGEKACAGGEGFHPEGLPVCGPGCVQTRDEQTWYAVGKQPDGTGHAERGRDGWRWPSVSCRMGH